MITFTFASCIDKFYPYRTALLQASIWIELDEQETQRIRKYLERMGYKIDNHICWKNRDGMCFSYSDRSLGARFRNSRRKILNIYDYVRGQNSFTLFSNSKHST